MIRSWMMGLLVLIGIFGSEQSLIAGPITPGINWELFSWDQGVCSTALEGPFTFESDLYTILSLTDAFVAGDRFEGFDNGISIGTSYVPVSPNEQDDIWDPDWAYFSPYYSSGRYELDPGSHSLTFSVIETADGYESGGAFFRVGIDFELHETQVPEPATWVMFAFAAGAGLFWRFRSQPTRQPAQLIA